MTMVKDSDNGLREVSLAATIPQELEIMAMTNATVGSSVVRRVVQQVKLVSRLAETIAVSSRVEQPVIELYVAATRRAFEEAQALRSSNPIPDPSTLQRLADDAQAAYEQACAFSQNHTPPNLETVEAMAVQARQAYDEVRRFSHSAPLPSREVRQEIVRRHLELLDELDAEYGPPSDQEVEEARRALDELRGCR